MSPKKPQIEVITTNGNAACILAAGFRLQLGFPVKRLILQSCRPAEVDSQPDTIRFEAQRQKDGDVICAQFARLSRHGVDFRERIALRANLR
jgi:hypothetical protein